jgi:hypothetical protein
MNNHITIPARRLAARTTRQIARWQRRLSGRLHAEDTFARQARWTITPTRSGGRIYHDPRFGQLDATRAPGPPHEPAPPAAAPPRVPGALPAPGTNPLPPVPPGRAEPQRTSR